MMQSANNMAGKGVGAALMGLSVATGFFATGTEASDWSCCGSLDGCVINQEVRCPNCDPKTEYCCTDYGGTEKCPNG